VGNLGREPGGQGVEVARRIASSQSLQMIPMFERVARATLTAYASGWRWDVSPTAT